jgi:hypothetical protein
MIEARAAITSRAFDDEIVLTERDGGTDLTARMVAEQRGAMRLVRPLMARTTGTQFTANWEHLKRVLEAGAAKPDG